MKDVKNIIQKLMPAVVFARRYLKFIFFVGLLLISAFLVYQINQFASVEPSDDQVSEKLKAVSRPHIDQNAVSKIQNLQDQNVEVQTLFQQARNNPFNE